MALILKLNRGASYTTINLNDVTNYRVLDTWNPRRSTRKVSQFGGEPYKDVIESIPLYVKGTTAAVVLEKIEDILAAMEQAFAWKLGAIVDPVLLEYLPTGSSLGAVVQAAVLGTPADAADMLELAQLAMYMTGNSFETIITLPLWRRGLWLGAAETPAASSAVANPGKMSVTFANSLRIPSPVKLALASGSAAANSPFYSGLIACADVADKILIEEINITNWAATGLGFSIVADTNALASEFTRLIPTTNANTRLLENTTLSAALNTGARQFAVFMTVHNQSATISYLVSVRLETGSGNYGLNRTIVIPAGDDNNRIIKVGLYSLPATPTIIRMSITPSAVSALATDALDMDYMLIVAIDENTKTIALGESLLDFDALEVDHNLLEEPQPTVKSSTRFLSQESDLYINSVGTNLTCVLCGTGADDWAIAASAGGAPITYALTATRRTGYLVVR